MPSDTPRFVEINESLIGGSSELSSDQNSKRREPTTCEYILIIFYPLFLITVFTYFVYDIWTKDNIAKMSEDLMDRLMDLPPLAQILAILCVMIVWTMICLPSPMISFGVGFALKMYLSTFVAFCIGVVISFFGEGVALALSFVLGRFIFHPFAYKFLENNKYIHNLDLVVVHYGMRFSFMLHLVPILPGPLVDYALGATSIGFLDYSVGISGRLLFISLYVFLGTVSSSVEGMSNSIRSLQQLNYWQWGICIAFVSVVFLLIFLSLKLWAKREFKTVAESAQQKELSRHSLRMNEDIAG